MKILIVVLVSLFVIACAMSPTKTRHDFRVMKDQVFKEVDGQTLKGDIYQAKTAEAKPAVLVVHGGGWTNRSGDMARVCEKLAKAGFVAFNITYRLAPADHHPAQLNDVGDALQWLYDNAEKYQIDKENISGWGYSAGAHLILLAGLDRQQPPYFKSIVAGGTPAKLTAWPKSPLVTKLIGKPMNEAETEWESASPVNHVTADSPPVFLYHGQWDALVEPEQMAYMQAALEEKNVPVETDTVNFLGHIGTYLLGRGAENRGIEYIRAHVAQ